MLGKYHAYSLLLLQLVLLARQAAAAAAATTTTTPAPDFQYTCDMAGAVIITITNTEYDHYAVSNGATQVGVDAIVNGSCNRTLATVPGTVLTLTGCNREYPIYLYLMKTDDDKIVGGRKFHGYSLKCRLEDTGEKLSVQQHFTADQLPSTVTPKNVQPDITLTMSFNPTHARIGEPIAVTITETTTLLTDEHHYLVPQSCDAVEVLGSGALGPASKATIFTKNVDSDFFESAAFTSADKSATANLHAFKFLKSNEVEITCTVRVCPNADCLRTTTTTTTTTTAAPGGGPSGRRRRSVTNDEGTLHEVTGTFQIDSNSDNNSSSAGDRTDAPRLLLLLTMFAACILRQMIH